MRAHIQLSIATLLFLLLVNASTVLAQNVAESVVEGGDVVRVNTSMARVGVTIYPDAPADLRWRVLIDGLEKNEFTLDRPLDNPLSLTVVVDAGGKRTPDMGWNYKQVEKQLARLQKVLGLAARPFVIIAAPSTSRLPFKLPCEWEASYQGDIQQALAEGIKRTEGTSNVRRALLIITDRLDDLPPTIFADTDSRMVNMSSLVYYMAISQPKKNAEGRRSSRVNLNGETFIIQNDSDFISNQFKHFIRLASFMHVITVPLGDEPGNHTIEVVAATDRGRLVGKQKRQYVITTAE